MVRTRSTTSLRAPTKGAVNRARWSARRPDERRSSWLPTLVSRIARPGVHLAEVAVHGEIVGRLRVKRRDEEDRCAGHDRLAVALSQDFRARPEPPYAWRADVDHLHGDQTAVERRHAVLLERLPLAAIGVALHNGVQKPQRK